MGRKKPRRNNTGLQKLNNIKINVSNKTLTALLCVLAVVCLFAGGVYIDTFHGNGMFKSFLAKMNGTESNQPEGSALEESMAVDLSSKATMAVFGEEFLLCTKDGVKYFAAMGDQKWSDTFNMTSPAMVQEGDHVAVGDMGGKTVRVYNREGMLYDLQTEGSPVQFALNEKGYLSIITRIDDAYRIRVYNTKGSLLKERVEESSGVYPLSSDISDDSQVFAVSYLDTTDISPIGRVVLFYIAAEASEEHTDSMFAAVEKTGELIPVIHYMDGGVLAAVSDVNIYGIDADGSEIWKYELENTLDQASFHMKEYAVLAFGDSMAGKEGREKGTVCWLDHNGKEKASYESGESVTYLLAAEKGVVIGNDRSYKGLTHGGSESWDYTATMDLTDLIPMQKLERAMLVGKEEVAIYDMTKMQNPVAKQEEVTDRRTERVPAEEKQKDTGDTGAEPENKKDGEDEVTSDAEEPAEQQDGNES